MNKFQLININLPENKDWLDIFEEYRENVMMRQPIRSENYSKKRFNLNNQLATFVLFKDQKIVLVSSICRLIGWPQSSARVMNRLFLDPNFRKYNLSSGASNLEFYYNTFMYDSVIKEAERNQINTVFVSRENLGKLNAIKSILKINQKKNINWALSDNYFLTCPYENNQNCWQRIIYLNLNNTEDNLETIPQISANNYFNKFVY